MLHLSPHVLKVPQHSTLLALYLLLKITQVVLLLTQQEQHLLSVELLLRQQRSAGHTQVLLLGYTRSTDGRGLLGQVAFTEEAVLLLALGLLGSEVVGFDGSAWLGCGLGWGFRQGRGIEIVVFK
jgi:hypothetical protein